MKIEMDIEQLIRLVAREIAAEVITEHMANCTNKIVWDWKLIAALSAVASATGGIGAVIVQMIGG